MRPTSFARAALGAVTLAALGPALVTVASCEVVLGDLPPVGATSSGVGASSSSATGPSGSASTSGSTASSSSSSSSGTSSAGGSSGGCCDCDGDTFDAEGTCGGKDCDDHDKLVYPGEPTYYTMRASNPAIGFDYDCSGEPDPNPALNVTVNCNAIGLPCATSEGYLATTPPACGMPGEWGTCKQQGIGCVNDVIDSARVMSCK